MAFLELDKVCFTYPGQAEPALTEISLVFEQEEITALIGHNGSGKTTLTKLIIGVLKPQEGKIILSGRIIKEYSLAEVGRRIGYVFQNPDLQLFCASVEQEIGFGPEKSGRSQEEVKEIVDFYLEYFELANYRNTFPLHLSQGEKQRLAIAAMLANEPEFLILDEPTVGLDAYRKKNLEDYLKKVAALGRGMIIVSHDTDFVHRMTQRKIVLAKGKLLE